MHRALFLALTLTTISLATACYTSSDSDSESNGTDTSTDTDDVDTGEMGDGDEYISDVNVEVLTEVQTILVVTWNQDVEADDVWLEFTFENDEFFRSYKKTADTGARQEVILGVPEETEVTFHVVSQVGSQQAWSSPYTGTTGSLPFLLPEATVESYDETIASPNRWMLGTVDDATSDNDYYGGPFWLFIIDRQGRIVWYHSDLGDNPIIAFPRVSRNGRNIFYGNRTPWGDSWGFVPKVTKLTLDKSFYLDIPMAVADNVDETDDGCLLFNTADGGYSNSWLKEWQPDGTIRDIWFCGAVFGDECYSNTVNWDPASDSVLMSFPYLKTVVQIDRQSGEMIASYGNASGSYDFSPPSWEFGFQHYANITPEGTLMVSSHMPGNGYTHAFLEFDIDHDNEVITEKWVYNEGPEWAEYMGEAHRIPNGDGSVLANYGTGGVIREITPDQETAWYVKFDAPFANDFYNKMVGHCTLIDDLYAINQGPE